MLKPRRFVISFFLDAGIDRARAAEIERGVEERAEERKVEIMKGDFNTGDLVSYVRRSRPWKFVISLYPHFEAYALTCISEVLFACRDFAGFPGEFIAEILSQLFGDPVSFIPRFPLFFAVAGSSEDSDALHAAFGCVISAIPPDLLIS
jgi:hypothetical protein